MLFKFVNLYIFVNVIFKKTYEITFITLLNYVYYVFIKYYKKFWNEIIEFLWNFVNKCKFNINSLRVIIITYSILS